MFRASFPMPRSTSAPCRAMSRMGPQGQSGYDGYGCFQTATESAGGNPCQPVNDIAGLKIRHPGEVGFIGGLSIQNVIDRTGVTEEDIRAEVRRCIDTYAPGGAYALYGTTLDIYNPDAYAPGRKVGVIIEECAKYGKDFCA